jgi:hypothetical protein
LVSPVDANLLLVDTTAVKSLHGALGSTGVVVLNETVVVALGLELKGYIASEKVLCDGVKKDVEAEKKEVVEVVEVVVVMVVEGDSYEVTRPRAIDKQGRTLYDELSM